MRDLPGVRASSPQIGVAGRPTTDEERSYVKQAVFLLRFRMRHMPVAPDGAATPLPTLD